MIYVVRHGEAEMNITGVLRARTDDDALTEKGRTQARVAGKELKGVKFDRAYASPLLRAIETAQIILDENDFWGKEADGFIMCDKRVIERDYGAFAGRKYRPYDGTAEFNIMASYDTRREREFKGVETIGAMKKRIWAFLDELKRKYPGENILVTSHHDAMILVHAYVDGVPADGDYHKANFYTPNCGIVKICNEKSGNGCAPAGEISNG